MTTDNPSNPKRIVIVGGVAGGASAAARARRLDEHASIILLERGPDVSFANCGMPYHIGEVIAEREHLLVQTPQALRRRFGIDARTNTEVLRIDREARQVFLRDVRTGQQATLPYDALILSPGAEPVRPPIPGLEGPRVFTLRSLSDMDAIKAAIDGRKPGRVLVVGGGYVGLEMADAFRGRGIPVTLVELAPQVFGVIDPEMAEPIHQHLRAHGVDLRLGTSVTSAREEGGELRVVLGDGEELTCGLAVVAIGVRPDVKLAREAGLDIGPTGGIRVDEHMRTSDPAIFAVGDAVEVTDFVTGRPALVPLAGPANRQGRIAADNAFGRDSAYRKTQGTAICKVFDLAVGITGPSERCLQRAGVACEKVYIHAASHAGYYPGAHPISLKLLFDPKDGRILGVQAVGREGVDKRIDVLAVAIRAGMTVFDLEHLELAYAPPYGSAKDPVNYAGFAAANALRGDVRLCHTPDVTDPRADQMLLDVRTPAEVQAGTIPGAVNVPIDELRDRLGDLPRDKEVLVFCRVGLRGYLACRILQQSGFRCRNLTGGFLTYSAAVRSLPKEEPTMLETTRDTGEEPETPVPTPAPAAGAAPVKQIDCTSLQCPGPIMRLAKEVEALAPGQALAMTASDPGFAPDVQGWCQATGNTLAAMETLPDGRFRATVVKAAADPVPRNVVAANSAANHGTRPNGNGKTIVVFSGDLDRVMGAFVIANAAAAMGGPVTMFFTFWGLNALRRADVHATGKSLIERMFGWMMPRGADKLKLSKMNMGGLGTLMMKGRMKDRKVAPLTELIASARQAGVRLVACTMSMDVMGLRKEELLEGVELGGAATYLAQAQQGNVNLFI